MDAFMIQQADQASYNAFNKPKTIDDMRAIKNAAQARKTAEEFEAMFLTEMVEHMFAGISTDGPFGGGHGEKMFRSMLSQEYAKVMSGRGGIGIAEMVQKQILMMQEEASK